MSAYFILYITVLNCINHADLELSLKGNERDMCKWGSFQSEGKRIQERNDVLSCLHYLSCFNFVGPRRQKTVSERFADMQERLVKPEKATRIDKVSKAEKTSKNDKKATKVTERSDGNENEQMNAAVGVDIVNKKSNESKKDREPVASKKKTGKQKDAKKKNGNAKKK